MANKNCPKCNGTGMVKDADGSVHTCWECYGKGAMDQHSKEIKESKLTV